MNIIVIISNNSLSKKLRQHVFQNKMFLISFGRRIRFVLGDAFS